MPKDSVSCKSDLVFLIAKSTHTFFCFFILWLVEKKVIWFYFPQQSYQLSLVFIKKKKTIKLLFSSLLKNENLFGSCFKNYLFWKLSIETKNDSTKTYSYKKTSNFFRRQKQASEHACNVYPSLSRYSWILFRVIWTAIKSWFSDIPTNGLTKKIK